VRHRLLLISAFVGSVLWASSSALAAGSNLVAINIVDAPRPQDRWGYAPGSRQVAPGTWVTWSNAGSDTHTVTATDGSFDSGELDPSQGFSWYFDTPGTYEYVCTLHPWMQGTIVVGNGVGAASSIGNSLAPAPPADDSTAPAPDDGTSD
jgi:plastocyanin